MKPVKKTLFFLFLGTAFYANAQKLPTIQQISLRAPANIKVDGKAIEWNNKFRANNHSTDIYYTLCNDDNNLYLTIQAVYPDVIHRIINGGITFTVNKSGKKNDPQARSVTYPVFTSGNLLRINFKTMPQIIPGSAATVLQADSFMNASNKSMNNKSKWIRTSGIKDVDTLISVYNEDGIKGAALFDNKMVYTCELSIALKHFNLSANDASKFAYHIMINEVIQRGIDVKKNENGDIISVTVSKGAQIGQAATDFWGEYTLAKIK